VATRASALVRDFATCGVAAAQGYAIPLPAASPGRGNAIFPHRPFPGAAFMTATLGATRLLPRQRRT